MKKLLFWFSPILVLCTLTSCEITQKGDASMGFTISGDQKGQDPVTGSTVCDPNKKVRIQVAVSGGTQGNTFTVNAFCGGNLLGSSKATDPGNGRTGTKTKTKTQVNGNGSCSPMATTSPTWSYICDFNI